MSQRGTVRCPCTGTGQVSLTENRAEFPPKTGPDSPVFRTSSETRRVPLPLRRAACFRLRPSHGLAGFGGKRRDGGFNPATRKGIIPRSSKAKFNRGRVPLEGRQRGKSSPTGLCWPAMVALCKRDLLPASGIASDEHCSFSKAIRTNDDSTPCRKEENNAGNSDYRVRRAGVNAVLVNHSASVVCTVIAGNGLIASSSDCS